MYSYNKLQLNLAYHSGACKPFDQRSVVGHAVVNTGMKLNNEPIRLWVGVCVPLGQKVLYQERIMGQRGNA